VLKNPQEYLAIRQNARATIMQKYTINQSIKQYMRLINSII
jgi:glycosyltransferase involved in cell wall biosynthesis